MATTTTPRDEAAVEAPPVILTYAQFGGVAAAHQKLTELAPLVPEKLAKGGHLGWTAMPKFGSQIGRASCRERVSSPV